MPSGSSDTGTTPPESCIFGLMTFFSACAGIVASITQLCSVIRAFPRFQLKKV